MGVPTQERTQASELVRTEARALLELALRLDGPMAGPFMQAIGLIVEAAARGGRVIVVGMGKSGLIGRKIAATLCSTGTRAHFLHPAEARHGDLGMVASGDVALALSASGETEELLDLLPALERMGAKIISLCGNAGSTLAQASAVWLDTSVGNVFTKSDGEPEDGTHSAHHLAPTASTTVMLALGDALALEVSRRRGFAAADFAELHPGGRLGRRLARVKTLMHSGEAMPQVASDTVMTQVIHEMSHKRLGMTTVVDAAVGSGPGSSRSARLIGVISDGDLRRLLERDGPNALAHTAGEIMNRAPVTIAPEAFAGEALALMEERKITSLVVTSPQGEALGVVHLHDLWESKG